MNNNLSNSKNELPDNVVLRVENLYKKFCRTLKHSMYYGAIDSARSMMGITYDTEILRKNEFWALEDISFELKKGEVLGIIGVNGSGKSTLLRLTTGIFPPDKGRISFKGRIGALIAVGAGFHPHMTGRENIYLNGTILGMTSREIDEKLDEIIDFAEIGDFLEAPVSTYSSGMRVRLGFAIAINCEPDILLLDEILAVGDVGFQLKCFNKLGELKKKGVASILVTHNLHHISTFCNRAVLLDKGKKIFIGNIDQCFEIYKKYFPHFKSAGEIEKVITGTDEFNIEKVIFVPGLEKNTISLENSDNLKIIISYNALKDFNNLELDCVLRAPIPITTEFFQATNHTYNKTINIKKGKGKLYFTLKNLNLNNFTLYLFFTIWSNNRTDCLFWWRNIPMKFIGNSTFTGMMKYQLEYSIENDVK